MACSISLFDETFAADLDGMSKSRKYDIAKGFWPDTVPSIECFDEQSYSPLFKYMGHELRHLRQHQRHFAVKDFAGTFIILEMLQKSSAKSRSEILQAVSEGFLNADPRSIRRSVELTIRLWLTLNVNSSVIAVGPTLPNEAPVDWEVDISLEDLVKRHFPPCSQPPDWNSRSKIDPTLTAAYLSNTCGTRLQWTDSISNHLQFDPKRQTLTVYQHKICLINHLEAKGGCPVPKDVLAEILDTLNLLFPFGDLATKQLLIKENQQPLYGLGNCGRPRKLDLAEFKYFREELEHLIDSFNQPPRTWRQLATDRRNKLEWAAFWITVMVAFLTLVSIPCNIIQAMYSVKAYNAALAQGSLQRREL